jgi:hypothetical protein
MTKFLEFLIYTICASFLFTGIVGEFNIWLFLRMLSAVLFTIAACRIAGGK